MVEHSQLYLLSKEVSLLVERAELELVVDVAECVVHGHEGLDAGREPVHVVDQDHVVEVVVGRGLGVAEPGEAKEKGFEL